MHCVKTLTTGAIGYRKQKKRKNQVRRRKIGGEGGGGERGASRSEFFLKLDRSLYISFSIRISVPMMARKNIKFSHSHSEVQFF